MAELGYSLGEVSKLLGLSRSIVTGLIDAGFVSPARGRRKEYRFTFQDLVMLRAARGLTEAGLSSTRILRSLRRLKSQLPNEVPRAGLRIEAAVQRKVEGQEIAISPSEPDQGGAQVIDLMEALRASLQKGAPKKAPGKPAPVQPAAVELKTAQRKPPKKVAQEAEPRRKVSKR